MALTESFGELFAILSAIDLFGSAKPNVGYPLPPKLADVTKVVAKGDKRIPRLFHDAYSAPLQDALPKIIQDTDPANLDDLTQLETLTGAVYQHGDQSVAPQLSRFLAVVSDLFRSFLSKKRRIAAGFPILETLPPLAMFQHSGDSGPFTLPCDAIQRMFGSTVGVVSLPAVYAPHPLLWGSLTHETCGHDVVHADAGLLPELISGVQAFFGGLPSGTSSPQSTQLMALLWSYWMDEAVADIYGVLNMGPSFGFNLISLFTALNAQSQPKKSRKPVLRNFSGFDPRNPAKRMDEHPTDLLRPYLVMGAIQAMQSLPQAARNQYSNDLDALAQLCSPGVTNISLAGVIELGDGSRVRVNQNMALQQMQLAAKQVGSFIASATLNSLDHHNIQELETWDAADEDTAQRIAATLLKDGSVADMGDDAQILAGATIATLKSPNLYQKITNRVNEALDLSFKQDPLWGKPRAEKAMLRLSSFAFLQISLFEVSRICNACVIDVTGFKGEILAQDPLSKFGIDNANAINDLVNTIVNDATDGVPSANYTIDPNALGLKSSTSFAQLEQMVVENSVPA